MGGTGACHDALITLLESGARPEDGALARALASPHCPDRLLAALAACPWVLRHRRLLIALLAHRRCPLPFALDAAAGLGWRDLALLAGNPRAHPRLRRQAERRLGERAATLTAGERRALARVAPRCVLTGMAREDDPSCLAALLDNPRFTAQDAVRVMAENRSPSCLLTLLRHERWGIDGHVQDAALRSGLVPHAVAMGILATLPLGRLRDLSSSDELAAPLRLAAARLADHRQRLGRGAAKRAATR